MNDIFTDSLELKSELSGQLDMMIRELQTLDLENHTVLNKVIWRITLGSYHRKQWLSFQKVSATQRSASFILNTKAPRIQSEQLVLDDKMIEEEIALANGENAFVQRYCVFLLYIVIVVLILKGETSRAEALGQRLPENWPEIYHQIQEQHNQLKLLSDSPVQKLTATHVIASVQHPKAGLGRFRWAFERQEVPESYREELTDRDELVVNITLDDDEKIKGMIITDVKKNVVEEYLPGMISHAYDDEAGRRHNDAIIRKRTDPIIADIQRWRKENPNFDD